MFGKPKPPPKLGGLAERVRQVSQRDAPREAARNPLLEPFAEPKPLGRLPRTKSREDRDAVYRNGVIILEDGARITVAVKNLSRKGARIEYFIRQELPARVMIVEPSTKLRAMARVVWQTDGAAGLEFIAGAPPPSRVRPM